MEDQDLHKVSNGVKILEAKNLLVVKDFPQTRNARFKGGTVCIKGEIYVFGGIGYDSNIVTSIEKYSPVTNAWKHVADMLDNHDLFSACSFMDSITSWWVV